MTTPANRRFGALAILGTAVAFVGVAFALSNADDPKVPNLSDLREAVAAAAKRGDNVAEIRKAVDVLERALAKGWTAPASGKTVEPPPELVALRDAVEAAAKKGENVEEIRKQLDIVEKAITGKIQTKPKPPLPDPFQPLEPVPPFNPNVPPIRPRPPLPLIPPPNMPLIPGAGVDPEAIQKAQDLMRRAAELMLKNPDDPEAKKMMQQAREMMLKAMLGRGAPFAPPPIQVPDNGGRVPERFRLGVRLERVSELAADQLGLEVARGVGIVGVVEGSVADKAGFKTFDIVLEFAGKPVSDNPEDFIRLVAEVKAGQKVDALVMRKGKKLEIKGIVLPEVVLPPFEGRGFGGPGVPFEGFPPLDNPRPAPRPNVRGNMERDFNNTTVITEENGQVVIKSSQNEVTYVIFGQRKEDGIVPSKITITDGEMKINAESLDKVPEKYRPVVERLLKSGQGRLPRR